LLVRTEQGRSFLLWSGHAHPIPAQWLPALDLRDVQPLAVDETFVAALPAGRPLAPPRIPGLGEPGPTLPGSSQPTTVGTVYADRTNAFYVMTRDGLASLTPLQAQLLLADPALGAAYAGSDPTPLKVSQAQVTEAAPRPWTEPAPAPPSGPPGGTSAEPVAPAPTLASDPAAPTPTPAPAPATVPDLTGAPPGEQQFCARYTGGSAPDLVVGPAEPAPGGTGGPVRLAPGQGALIARIPEPESNGRTDFLVTDSGIRYPLADQRAVEALGLAGAPIAQLPPELISAIPVGPTLDRAAAATPAG
jgi:hypothetical protein